jgi:hypothetical protein
VVLLGLSMHPDCEAPVGEKWRKGDLAGADFVALLGEKGLHGRQRWAAEVAVAHGLFPGGESY